MATATVTITGTKFGLPSGTVTINARPIVNTNTTGADTVLSSASGDNTIAIPSGSVGAILIPPSGNTVAMTLKGSAGDTGLPLNVTNPSLYSFPPGTASFILNVASSGVQVEILFI